jgi:hypothetical protein
MLVALAFLAATTGLRSANLHVSGTRILGPDGAEVKFHGINVPSLEWTAVGDHVTESIGVALDKWGANLVRVPLSQDRWFGKAPDSKDDGTSYRKIVDEVVSMVSARGKHVLLDLHWSDGGVWGQDIGQHTLPDAHSLQFWRDCGKHFANVPAVIFDLYNEPIEASWNVWRDGGQVSETFQGKKLNYHAVGLQTLLDAIRETGAKNVVLAGGLGYASRLDGIPTHLLVDKTGHGVIYANHFYPGWEGYESWEKRVTAAARTLPLLIGEFGADPGSVPLDFPKRRVAQVLSVLKIHNWSWCAWCMHPAATPCLITDWSYKPTEYFGDLVLAALRGENVPIPGRQIKAEDHTVFDGSLKNQFQSWSSAKVDLAASTSHSDSHGIKVDAEVGQQLQLGTVPFDGMPYRAISFWVNGGAIGGQKLVLRANIMDAAQTPVALPELKPAEWTHVEITFVDLGIAGQEGVKSFTLRSANGAALPTYFIDDIVIQGNH